MKTSKSISGAKILGANAHRSFRFSSPVVSSLFNEKAAKEKVGVKIFTEQEIRQIENGKIVSD